MIDVKFLEESTPDVKLATPGFPNLKMLKTRFFSLFNISLVAFL